MYSAFGRGHCYEPYLQNGNLSTSDPAYGVGAVVQFSCDPGHSLEQGPALIECINSRDPYWNDTEPICKGTRDVMSVMGALWAACGSGGGAGRLVTGRLLV